MSDTRIVMSLGQMNMSQARMIISQAQMVVSRGRVSMCAGRSEMTPERMGMSSERIGVSWRHNDVSGGRNSMSAGHNDVRVRHTGMLAGYDRGLSGCIESSSKNARSAPGRNRTPHGSGTARRWGSVPARSPGTHSVRVTFFRLRLKNTASSSAATLSPGIRDLFCFTAL